MLLRLRVRDHDSDAACAKLRLANIEDPVRELVAEKVVKYARGGVRDSELLCRMVLVEIQN
jgi:hypothetical protein